MSLTIGSLFSGSGMLDEAVRAVYGGKVAWHAEHEPATEKNPRPTQAAARLLAYRYPDVPNLGDISAVDWSTVAPVDVLTGGFPCQDVSHAGKRAGLRAGTRSGLWARMCDAIDQLRPGLVVAENVRGLLSAEADSAMEPCPGCVGDGDDRTVLRALGRVLGDLADLGYDARWCGLRAADVGAPHGRFRVFILATDTASSGREGREGEHWWQSDAGWRDPRVSAERRGEARARSGIAVADPERVGRDGRAHDARRGTLGRAAAAGTGALTAADAGGEAGNVGPGLRAGVPGNLGRGRSGDHAAPATADTDRSRSQGRESAPGRHLPDRGVAADANSDGLEGLEGLGWLEPVGRDIDRRGSADVAWGVYEPAIRRWQSVLGRPAPAPTEPGPKGGQRLSPRLTEWMMGWPDGWVTDVPGITRNEALRICGNGVVPQQAVEALRRLDAMAFEAGAA